ncbi:MASE3 domain-containing protein [Azospirillum thermophilum]|uniref:MASE3 domain-containing protein n=1 Tax=Azospirillum thermophilum TaxID=2202148 RepID=UPI00143CC1FB|nr:MASE3 domain-containing protein [Azospirillum thermophilum]
MDSAAFPSRSSYRSWLAGYWPEIAFVGGTLGVLSAVFDRNYLLFHLCVELFAVIVAFTTFAVAWNTRDANQSPFLACVGLSFPAVGTLDLLHIAAYPGMGILGDGTPNLSIQLWLAARFIQSLAFLGAPLLADRTLRSGDVLIAQAAAFLAAFMAIFLFDIVPDGFTPGDGLTGFKLAAEYVIIAIAAAACLVIWRRRRQFSRGIFVMVLLGVGLMIPQELAFTLYDDPHGPMNAVGHFFKVLSFYLLYKAIVVSALKHPYDLVFLRMRRSEEALRDHLNNLESIIATRTAELRESEARWRALLECSNDWFWETDRDGRFTALSARAQESTGRGGKDLLGFRHEDLLDRSRPTEDFDAMVEAQREHKPFRRLSFPLVGPEGAEPRWVMVSGVPRFDGQGGFLGYRGTSSDITARRQASEAARRKQTMAALGSLVGGLAHEVNNLLQPIVTLSEMAVKRVNGDARLKTYLFTIHDSGLKARDVLRDVLRFARIEVAESPPGDLVEAVRSAVALARPALPPGVEVKVQLPPNLPSVTITATELAQVLLNLIKNGGDAMPEGGLLTIQAESLTMSEAEASHQGLAEGRYIRLTVSDTGIGMDEQTRQRVFEPFFTTKPVGEGTGLGLAVVYGILRNGGGDVTVRSAVGRGSTFILDLPVTRPGDSD